jgi:hypothetical protein
MKKRYERERSMLRDGSKSICTEYERWERRDKPNNL